jgi:hypothetical protein
MSSAQMLSTYVPKKLYLMCFSASLRSDSHRSFSFQMIPVGALTEVNCDNIIIKEGDVDIGANASAEEQSEALEDGAKTVSGFEISSLNTYVGELMLLPHHTGQQLGPHFPIASHLVRQENLHDISQGLHESSQGSPCYLQS